MLTSKKPRKKSVRAPGSPELTRLPDSAALKDLAQRLDIRPDEEALGEAQGLIYDAWETSDGRSRTALARRALKISPFCADAWLILADRPLKSCCANTMTNSALSSVTRKPCSPSNNTVTLMQRETQQR